MAKLHIRHGRLACQDLWWYSLPAIHIHQGRGQTKPSLLVRTVAVFFTRRDIRSTPGCSCTCAARNVVHPLTAIHEVAAYAQHVTPCLAQQLRS